MIRRRLNILAYAVLGAHTVVVAVPFATMLAASLKTRREILTAPLSLPAVPQWDNYARAWQQGLGRYLLNSLLVTGVTVSLIVAVGALAAYAMARLRFRGRFVLYALIVAGYAVPVHTVLVPLYRMLSAAGLLNSYPGLILPYIAFGIPFSIMLLYAFFQDFPAELEDAARIDGCGDWQVLRHVVAPLSLPGLASVAIFQGVFTWNEFLLALLVISDDGMKTLPAGLAAFQGEYANDWGAMMAGVTVATAPMLLLYVLLQRHFVRNLAGIGK